MTAETYIFKTVDGCELKADVYLPDVAEGKRPVLLRMHGGGLISGSRDGFVEKHAAQAETYLTEGYIVVSIDYRLAPEVKVGAIVEDVEDAYKWLREKGPELFGADPERIAVTGTSAGGYLSLMAGVRLRPRPRAIVSFYGYGDLAGVWVNEPNLYGHPPSMTMEEAMEIMGGPVRTSPGEMRPDRKRVIKFFREEGLWGQQVVGHDPYAEPEAFTPFCPLQNVTESYPPTFLLHGNADSGVPFQQSVMMAKELHRHEVECEYFEVPGGLHGFDRKQADDPKVKEALERVQMFLRKHLK